MAEFTPRVVKRTAIGFHPTVLPTVYDDALSYYEELNKILHSLNDAIDVIDENRALILQLDANVKELDARLTAQIKRVADDLAALRDEYENFRDEVQAKILAIEAKNNEQDERLTSIETKNNEQDARLTAIETKNTQQDGEINALKARCTALESNLSTVTTRVTTLESNLTKLTARVSTAESHITELQGDVTRIDQEQTVQNNRIKALEDTPGGGTGSRWGTVQVYQLWNNDASNGSLTNTHFIRHVDLSDNKYNILLNTGSCNSAVPLGALFAHKNFVVPGQPQLDELIITSWDPAVCNAEAITAIKQHYAIKHAWIPSSINWTNYTGEDKEVVKAVEAAVIKALNENGTTQFTRMGDNGQIISVGAIRFDCLYDSTRYGVTSANMVCRIHCNCDMVVSGNDDITTVAKNNVPVRNWFPNMMVIDVPSNAYVVPKYTLDKVSKNVLTHISYDQSGAVPAEYAQYMGLQWCNTAGGDNQTGYSSMVELSGDIPRLMATSNTVYVPEVGYDDVPQYNVKTFGAVGDGNVDDTEAIQTAIDYAARTGVRAIYFPAGTYIVTRPLHAQVETGTTTVGGTSRSKYAYGMGITIRGEQIGKTVLRKTGQETYTIPANNNINGGNTVDTTLFFGGTEGTGLYISDISIENASNNECYGIYATRARCVLERLNVCTNSHGVYLYGWLNNLTDVNITAKEKGLWVANATSTVCNKVFVAGCNNPYYLVSAYYSTLISCCADNCTGTIWTLKGSITMSGCGSESKGADRYIDLLDDTRVDTHGLYLYDLEAPSGSTGTNKALFRMANRCVLNVDGIQLAGTASTQGVQNALLECGTASVSFAVQDILLFNNGASPLTPELCKGSIPTGSLFRLNYSSYSGFYKYTTDGLTPTIAFTVPDASVTPAKTTFIQPAEGHYETQPNYTNVLPNAVTPPSGNDLTVHGTIPGRRYGAGTLNSPPQMASAITVTSSGFIPGVKVGDVIRISGLYIAKTSENYVGFANADKNFIGGTNGTNFVNSAATVWNATIDENALTTTFTIPEKDSANRPLASVAYLYFSGKPNTIGPVIVTINEEIVNKQVWVGQPMQFGNEVKQNMNNVFMQAPNGTLYTIEVDDIGNLKAKQFSV